MERDAIDDMVAEWAAREPARNVSVLQVVGRLFRVVEHARTELAGVLRPFGLTQGDFDVLSTLRRRGDRHGTHPRELARSVLISSGAMTTRLDRLVAAGLVRRVPDGTDRRAVLVHLTAAGNRLTGRALSAVLAADEELVAGLDDAERDVLAGLLRKLG